MKNKNWLKTVALFGMITLSIFSCKKDEDDNETTSAADNALAEQTFDDVKTIADQAADGSLTSFKTGGITSGCATITHDTVSDPRVLTINFGTVNCMCNDGRNRRGSIIVTYTGHYKDAGSIHTISFSDYFVNDNHVMGTKTVENMGLNGNGNPYFTVEINGSIELANGEGTITQVSSRTREWIEGSSTQDWSDDVYLITGTASGSRADNGSYTAEVTTPLRKEIGCRWIVSGVLEVTPGDKPTRSIDFGNGDCDDQAVVTVNGHTFNITLR